MITAMLKPFTAAWGAVVNYHRQHLDDDPDVKKLHEQEEDAIKSNKRLDAIERHFMEDELIQRLERERGRHA